MVRGVGRFIDWVSDQTGITISQQFDFFRIAVHTSEGKTWPGSIPKGEIA
jgi:hypothetical protein